MTTDTIPHRLFDQARVRPAAPAYRCKSNGRWEATSWSGYADQVKAAAKALMALGFAPGHTVSILGSNRPEWVIFDLAAMAAGGAPAGIYSTCSPPEVRHIINHAESRLVLVENAAQWAKVEQELANLPRLEHVVQMRGAGIKHPKVLGWEEFLERGRSVEDAAFMERLSGLKPEGLATLIYTSGTTGPPKGVMLSHRNLAWTGQLAIDMVQGNPSDESLSYLPLSHIAEQAFTLLAPITSGSVVSFAESLDQVPENLKEVRPTVFFGVPRIWEKFYAAINGKLQSAPPLRQSIAGAARRVGRAYHGELNAGRAPGLRLRLGHRVADRVVFSKLKEALGFGRLRVAVSGAAPIAPEVLEFFMGLDIPIREVYGQSEDTGPTSFNLPGKTRPGTVGPPIPGIDVTFGIDGEILVRGPHVFLGYYKDPAATAEALVDGWLHSGDLGKLDEDGFLVITGRKKDIIITAGGKNIAPKNIEGALRNHPLIGEAVVIGDRRKYLTVLIALDLEAARAFMTPRGLSGTPDASAEVRAEIQRAVDEVNRDLARVESVKKFHIVVSPFSIETGELTPTLKVKRNAVQRLHAAAIEAMYTE